MNLSQWLEHIARVHPVSWDLGIERVGKVGELLGVLKPARKVVLVAGTNGKGSVCETLNQLALSHGWTVGKTTSPFLLRYNEQFEINGAPVSDEDIVSAFESIDAARGDVTLTNFEFGALAALVLFSRQLLDLAILEIGLGGRLDAMNIADPDVSVITQIDIDHEEWLGHDRETIGREKAGILRAGVPLVLSDANPPKSILECARDLDAPVSLIEKDFRLLERSIQTGDGREYVLSSAPQLPVPSVAAAVEAARLIGMPLETDPVAEACERAVLPGRFQRVGRVILDVAHNPNAARLLASHLRQAGLSNIHAVCGMYKDKDRRGVFEALRELVDHWYLADIPGERGATGQQLQASLSELGEVNTTSYANIAEAYEAVSLQNQQTVILVFGSFPAVGTVLEILRVSNPV